MNGEKTDATWRKLERKVIARDKHRCQAACGCTARLTVHHIIPRGEGGSNDLTNMITLCRLCHDEIDGTSIRTKAEVHAFDAQWHATATWWPMKAAPKPRQKVTPRKTKAVKLHQARVWPVHVCIECGKEYFAETSRSRMCGHQCRWRHADAEMKRKMESDKMYNAL